MGLTAVEIQIIETIKSRGGCASNLLSICNDLGIDYAHAHYLLNRLECAGRVRVIRRKRGIALQMFTNDFD